MRKASDATQLRQSKSQLKSLKTYQQSLILEIRERRRVGAMLANVAYNLAQRPAVEPELKAVLDECRKAWDEIRKVPV